MTPPARSTGPIGLPIEAHARPITNAIADGALVLTAEPGAGKTSIVPLLAVEAAAGTGRPARVVVLEPRRLAARAAAQRLADLIEPRGGRTDGNVGDLVGLTMRGERRRSNRTVIEVVTEAVLTARLQRDPELADVGVIVFDEFHERNLHADLGLAMALEARATIRPDLAVVVMSATLELAPVAALLGTDRLIEVPGRTHPVETAHLDRPPRDRWSSAVAETTRRALAEVAGDVLVFVPGRREIGDVTGLLAGCGAQVLGLHGGSDRTAQQRALTGPTTRSTGRRSTARASRRVIVATAVAETSVTLPGIEAVVDGGLLRRARYDPATGLGRLETVSVTRFSADQRRGRAGRLGPGRCYRLWSTEDHRLLEEAVPPEIVDGDPLPVAFELARWGDPDGTSLPLLDHPGADRLAAGRRLLSELSLLDDRGAPTARGSAAGSLGVHPRIGALLLTAADLDLIEVGSVVAALLDDDRWPTTADLEAEVERSWSDLRRRAEQLRSRLVRVGAASGPAEGSSGRPPPIELGRLVAAAWPDRIAIRRANDPGRYLLATGREVGIDADEPLAGAELLVVAEADGHARRARIRRAVPIDRATLLDAVGHRIEWVESVRWDDRTRSVRAEREQRIGAIVLHREPLAEPASARLAAALADGLRRVGLDLLRWSDPALGIRQRLAWLHAVDADHWPAVDDDALIDRLDEWLDTSRCRTTDDVARLGVGSSLLGLLDWRQRSGLDELAPTQVVLPGGGRRQLDYSSGRPVLAARIQELFGLDHHPTVGPHSTPISIELLSPAGRPAQVTTDLPGFWRGSYAEVRRELRGRYPKHDWPEEPWRRAP